MTKGPLEGWTRPLRGWVVLAVVLLAVILIPFALWEESLTSWSRRMIGGPAGDGLIAAAIAGLLALDVVLPVPSSLLSTAAGYRLGVVAGAGASWVGMTLGCGLAYALGYVFGHGPSVRLVGDDAMERATNAMQRHAIWMLAVSRPVPVLAEASVLMAGVGRMRFLPFAAVTLLSNLGVSVAYAWVGARSAEAGSFLLAFAAAVLVPLVATVLVRGRSGVRSA